MKKQGCRGAVAVEMAIFAVLLVALLAGFINLSAAWRVKHILTKASREAVRVAVVTPNLQLDDPAVLGVVRAVMEENGFSPGSYAGSVSFSEPLATGQPITVNVTSQSEPMVSGSLSEQAQSINLSASSVMRYQQVNEGG